MARLRVEIPPTGEPNYPQTQSMMMPASTQSYVGPSASMYYEEEDGGSNRQSRVVSQPAPLLDQCEHRPKSA
jgi:hypothetical protein